MSSLNLRREVKIPTSNLTEKKMTPLKLLMAGLAAAAMLATPAMARQTHTAPNVDDSTDTYAAAAPAVPVAPATRYVDGRTCVPAPRVGAYATDPWNDGNVPCEPRTGY
jgi:hypothetical protein